MASTTVATVMKMIESLPEETQDLVVEHLRGYLLEMQDDTKWNEAFKKTRPQLIAAARRATKEIADGLAKPLKHTDL